MTEEKQNSPITASASNSTGDPISLPGHEMEKAAAEVFRVLAKETGEGIAEVTGNAFGALLGDKVRDWRTRNMVRTAANTKKLFDELGIPIEKTKALPLGEFYALFEGASTEDDPNLSDMWSRLLATAMTSSSQQLQLKGFCAILKQMTPFDARLIKYVSEREVLIKEYRKKLGQLGFHRYTESKPDNDEHKKLLENYWLSTKSLENIWVEDKTARKRAINACIRMGLLEFELNELDETSLVDIFLIPDIDSGRERNQNILSISEVTKTFEWIRKGMLINSGKSDPSNIDDILKPRSLDSEEYRVTELGSDFLKACSS